jgi:hypothetical protein
VAVSGGEPRLVVAVTGIRRKLPSGDSVASPTRRALKEAVLRVLLCGTASRLGV